MLKTVLSIIKKIILAFILIYSIDLILGNANIFIPLNIWTIILTTILGPFGIVALIILKMIII